MENLNFPFCILLLFRPFVNNRSRSFARFYILLHSFADSFTFCSIFAISVHIRHRRRTLFPRFFGNFALSLDREKSYAIIVTESSRTRI